VLSFFSLFRFLAFAPRTSSLDTRNSDFDSRAERASVREREREINGRARVSPTRVALNFICIAKKNKKIFQQQKRKKRSFVSHQKVISLACLIRIYFVRYERKTEEEEEEEEEEE
jgi:hypothetical protein